MGKGLVMEIYCILQLFLRLIYCFSMSWEGHILQISMYFSSCLQNSVHTTVQNKSRCDQLSCLIDSHVSAYESEKSHGLSLPFKLWLQKYTCTMLPYFSMWAYNFQYSDVAKFLVGVTGLTKQIRVSCTIYQVSSQKSRACAKYKRYEIHCISLGDCTICTTSLALSAQYTAHGQYTWSTLLVWTWGSLI